MSKILTLHLPDTMPAVERALVEEVMDGLMEYVHGEDVTNLWNAKVALVVLYQYVYETQKCPATHDGSGDIVNKSIDAIPLYPNGPSSTGVTR